MVVALSLGFSSLLIGFIFIEWFVFDPLLEFITLFFGVFIGMYSVRDIYDGKYKADHTIYIVYSYEDVYLLTVNDVSPLI
jgi:hypothetical protein